MWFACDYFCTLMSHGFIVLWTLFTHVLCHILQRSCMLFCTVVIAMWADCEPFSCKISKSFSVPMQALVVYWLRLRTYWIVSSWFAWNVHAILWFLFLGGCCCSTRNWYGSWAGGGAAEEVRWLQRWPKGQWGPSAGDEPDWWVLYILFCFSLGKNCSTYLFLHYFFPFTATALTSVGQTETAVRIRQQIEDLNAR